MKKVILALTFLSLCLLKGNAQIFNTITYLDKFDDALKIDKRKTLITQTDSTFVIEEKGKKPVVYLIINEMYEYNKGREDSVVCLINNVYGYERIWCVIKMDQLEDYRSLGKKLLQSVFEEEDKHEEIIKEISTYWLYITHRTVTTQYSGTYISDYFWIMDEKHSDKLGKDVERIVYTNK